MTLKEANDILQHPKKYWSYEVEEAQEYAKDVLKVLCEHGENERIIKSIDYYIALIKQFRESKERKK